MASDLLTIAASGAKAARSALDVTAQNIANTATEGYVRRSARMEEVSATGTMMRISDISLSGVRVAGLTRNADMFRQAEVRRTGSDAARAAAELSGLENVEAAVEQAGVYNAIVGFEASLQQLSANPADPSLRANVIGTADAMAGKFRIAAGSLEAVGEGARFAAGAAVDEANVLTGELARLNLRIGRSGPGSADRATLLDQRDLMLEKLSAITDISTSFNVDGSVGVTVGGTPGTPLVTGGTAQPLAMITAGDGTVSYTAGGTAFAPAGGKLAGHALALGEVAAARTSLDNLADQIGGLANAAQGTGVALGGGPAPAMFTIGGAAGMRLALTDGSQIATAPAGSPAGSRDGANLAALRAALDSGGVAKAMNGVLFDISSKVAGRTVTREALDAIASSSRIALQEQSGVDLDTEAANLIRFQQAFQASGKAMQVATDIFETLLGIG